MTTSDPTPTVEVKRFHRPFPGMPDLYHTYCSACPDYGTCGERDAAESSARQHERWHAESDGANDSNLSDATGTAEVSVPGNHAELIARFTYHFPAENLSPTATDVRDEMVSALRAEQSARQAAEQEMHSRELHHFEAEELLAAAEERERALIAGVREGITNVIADLDASRRDGTIYTYGNVQAKLAVILSRLLPSTPTEEGKSHE